MQIGTGFSWASFLLLFTTSGDVLCLKFIRVWEMLWIFKVARWTHDRCMKTNKSPTVSNGIGDSSFEIWTANLAQSFTVGTLKLMELHLWRFRLEILQRRLPRMHPKTWHSNVDISDLGNFFLCFYFWVKKSKPVGYTRTLTVFANWEKYEVSWNFYLVYITDFLKLYPGTKWHCYCPLHGIL